MDEMPEELQCQHNIQWSYGCQDRYQTRDPKTKTMQHNVKNPKQMKSSNLMKLNLKMPIVIHMLLFFLKRRGYCYRLCPSVCPSICPSAMLSPPKPLDEIQPNLVCELLSCMGRATAIFFGPATWGPGKGSKGQISFIFNYKVNFKDFLYQTLCVYSQMKDTKHIRQNFYSVAWVMP